MRSAENLDFDGNAVQLEPDVKTGAAPESDEKPRHRGRPKGSRNRTTRLAKEAIAAAAPHDFLIRIMQGRKFKRAGVDGGKATTDCYPTLAQSITAAETLLRKIAPDVKAMEIGGIPGGEPLETRNMQISATTAEVMAAMAARPDDPLGGVDGETAAKLTAGLNFIAGAQQGAAALAAIDAQRKAGAARVNGAAPVEESPEPEPTQPGDEIDIGGGLVAVRHDDDGEGQRWQLVRRSDAGDTPLRLFRAVHDGTARQRVMSYVDAARAEGVL